jgi:hypothetical protein
MYRFPPPPPRGWLKLDRARIADTIAAMERMGAQHHVPVLRALGAWRITLTLMFRGAGQFPLAAIRRGGRPALIRIADDDEFAAGPEAFPAAWAALRWARAHIVHAAAGIAAHYEDAVATAEAKGSCALVECSSAHAPAWVEAARRAALPRQPPTLVL